MQLPFIFTVNDDLFMKNIISGAYLGSPDAHVVYMEYPLAFLLKCLYQLNGELPWYGASLLVFQLIGWISVGYRLLRGEQDKRQKLGKLAVIFLVFTSAGFYHMASMQFTVTAAIVGMAALVWFYTSDFDGPAMGVFKDNIGSILLAVLSFSIRRNVLLMLLPFAGMLWLRRWLAYSRQYRRQSPAGRAAGVLREQTIKFGVLAALCGTAVAVVYGISSIGYRSQDWQYYHSFNDAATVLYDYYGWPDYEENKELYEELDISREAYEGAKSAYLLCMDNGIDAQAMERLAQRSEELYRREHSAAQRLAEAVREAVSRMLTDTDKPLNYIVLSLYGIILLPAVLLKDREALLSLLFLWIGRSVAWLYVIYEGRYPVRITQSLLLAECGVLLVIWLKEAWLGKTAAPGGLIGVKAAGGKNWLNRAIIMLGILYLIFLGGLSFIRVRHVAYENTKRMEDSRDLQDLKDYCGRNGGNGYFVDSKSVSKYTESIFQYGGNQFENYIVFGGWLSKSPVYEQKLLEGGIEDAEREILQKDNIFVIFKNSEECPNDYLFDYYQSKYTDFTVREVDSFGREGRQFLVYQLRGAQQREKNT